MFPNSRTVLEHCLAHVCITTANSCIAGTGRNYVASACASFMKQNKLGSHGTSQAVSPHSMLQSKFFFCTSSDFMLSRLPVKISSSVAHAPSALLMAHNRVRVGVDSNAKQTLSQGTCLLNGKIESCALKVLTRILGHIQMVLDTFRMDLPCYFE